MGFAPRQMSSLRCVMALCAHSWGLDEVKAFPPLHSCGEHFVKFTRLEEVRVRPLSILWSTLLIAEAAYLTVLRHAPGAFVMLCYKTNTLLDFTP